jgi:hypothetical protein
MRRPCGKRIRRHDGSALAEFAPGLTLLFSFFVVVVSAGWYLTVQLALRDACDHAAAKVSDSFCATQAGQFLTEADGHFRTGLVGVLIDKTSARDGMTMQIEHSTVSGAGLACRVFGTYHVRVLMCPWLVGVRADASRVLEHPEGYLYVAESKK